MQEGVRTWTGADWPGQDPDHAEVVLRAVSALEDAGLPYLLIGGLASSLLGRPRTTEDVDLLVRPGDPDAALDALAEAGFETERTNPDWIYKACLHGVPVDLIFWLKGGITLSDEMLDRARLHELEGRAVHVVSP